MRLTRDILALSAFCICGCLNDPSTDAVEPDGLLPMKLMAVPIAYEATDTLELFRVSSLQGRDGVIVITEAGSKRALAVDVSTNTVTVFGREGRGPGEMDNPRFAAVDGTDIWINDIGNMRLTRYDSHGEYRGDVSAPPPSFFASFAAVDGELFAPGHPGQSTVQRLEGSEWTPYTPDTVPASVLPLVFSMLLGTPSGLLLIDVDGSIRQYDRHGETVRVVALPPDLKTAAVNAVVSARGAPPGPDQPLLKAASVNGEGVLVGMLVGRPDDVVGFRLVGDSTFQRIVPGSMNPAAEDVLRSAVGVATVGDTLFVAQMYGVSAFKLDPVR